MNKIEFQKEVQVYMEEKLKQFNKYQLITWDILVYLNSLLRDNNITYYLAYGTLLGAIRDNGQIPWDYDVDIHVKVSDRDRLIEVLRTKLSEDYYYVYSDKMGNYPAECLRVCKKGYTYMAFHVDVFFLCGCADSKQERIPLLKLARTWSNFRSHKYANYHFDETDKFSKLKQLLLKVYSVRYKVIPEWYIKRQEKKIHYTYEIEKCKYLMSYCFEANWGDNEYEVYPSEIFNEAIDITINGVQLLVPKGYDQYLKILFKDYMRYYPIEGRFKEFYYQCEQIEKRQAYFEKYLQHKIK